MLEEEGDEIWVKLRKKDIFTYVGKESKKPQKGLQI